MFPNRDTANFRAEEEEEGEGKSRRKIVQCSEDRKRTECYCSLKTLVLKINGKKPKTSKGLAALSKQYLLSRGSGQKKLYEKYNFRSKLLFLLSMRLYTANFH